MGVAQRREREKSQRRAVILDAAERVFWSRGLGSATMEEVAHEAELSKGTLYLYFSSKDELFVAIALRALGALETRLDEVAEHHAGATGVRLVTELLQTYAAFASEERERFRAAMSWVSAEYSISDATPGFEEYRASIARVFGLAARAVEAGQRDGSIRDDRDPGELAFQLWSSLLGSLMLGSNAHEASRRLPKPFDLHRVVTGLVDLLVRGLSADAKREVEDGDTAPDSGLRPESKGT